MAWSSQEIVNHLIAQVRQALVEVRIIDIDTDEHRTLVKLEGRWQNYRLIVSEVHRSDETVRYTYYALDENNNHIHRFDNAGDKKALKLRYGADWKAHQYEEIPHQHDTEGIVTLTATPMTFERFVEWLTNSLMS